MAAKVWAGFGSFPELASARSLSGAEGPLSQRRLRSASVGSVPEWSGGLSLSKDRRASTWGAWGFRWAALVCGLLLVQPLQAAPQIQHWETANGARVLFVAAPELPMVDIRVVFDAASARDGDLPGLASLTNAMLDQGAGDWDVSTIAERVEGVGAELGLGSLRDMAWLSLRSLTRQPNLDVAVTTLAQMLAAPTFPEEQLERLRSNRLVTLRQDEQSAGQVASKAIYRAVFGDHPYAADPDGTEASIAAIRREHLLAHFQRYYVARNALVAMVGALDRPQAEALAERITAGLAPGDLPPPLPEVQPLSSAQTQVIDFPSSQTHLSVGQTGIYRGDPDYFPLYVGNHILGGSGLVSILSEEIREKRGYSYSVYSYFSPMRRHGLFLMGLQTKHEQAADALALLLDNLRAFIAEGPSPERLTAAKRNITGGFPLQISSNKKIIDYLAMIGFYQLPLDYLDVFTAQIEAVTAEQIRDAFARRLHPDRLATVIVGAAPAQVTATAEVVAE